jgi:hypothetical protein
VTSRCVESGVPHLRARPSRDEAQVTAPRSACFRQRSGDRKLGSFPRAGAGLLAAILLLMAPPTRAQAPDVAPFRLEPPAALDDDRRPAHLGRALLEALLVQVGGTVWYWQDLEFNARDWDLRWDWASWRRKLLSLDALRFDQNEFGTNARWHPTWGAFTYQIARGNGLPAGRSFLFSFGSGVFWEYLVESNEYPSINDLVVNPTAGFAIGEPLYQLGEFFHRGSPSVFNRTVAGALSPVATTNDLVDGRRGGRDAVDGLGFSQERWHRFRLSGQLGSRTFDRTIARSEGGVGLGTELVMLPGYGRPGRFGRWVKPGSWSAVTAELETAASGVVGGRFLSRASVAGRYGQRIGRDPDGRVHGTGLLVGVGSGFEYDAHDRPDGRDFLAAMNVIGPMWEVTARSDGLRFRWSGDAYGDFAMVKSLALDGVAPAMTGDVYHPRESGGVMPSVVGARGYYYALGLTAGTRLDLEYWGWDTGMEARADQFDSIAGADRFKEEITHELALVDRRIVSRLWLGLRPWGRATRVGAGMEWRWRQGLADPQAPGAIDRERLDARAYLQLSLVF